MKKDIHPKVNMECTVTCVCGSKFSTISTLPTIQVDICSACHPLFTGQHKFVDTEGRIDKFAKRVKQSETKKQEHEELKSKKKAKVTAQPQEESIPQVSLKELLKQLKDEENATDKATQASKDKAEAETKTEQ